MRTTKVEYDGGTRFSLSRVSNKRKPRKLFTVPVLYQLSDGRALFPSCRWLPARGGEGHAYAAGYGPGGDARVQGQHVEGYGVACMSRGQWMYVVGEAVLDRAANPEDAEHWLKDFTRGDT